MSYDSKRLIAELNAKGIQLWVEGDTLKYHSPPGMFTSTLKEEVTAVKQDVILELLGAPCLYSPVSNAQKRIWLSEQFSTGHATYNIPVTWIVKGELSLNKIELAIRRIIRDNDVFRQSFKLASGELLCSYIDHPEFKFEEGDVVKTSVSQPIDENYLRTYIDDVISKEKIVTAPFDLEKPPLLRAAYYKFDDSHYCLVFVFHHIIIDEFSFATFMSQFRSYYSDTVSAGTNNSSDTSYKEYIQSQIVDRNSLLYSNNLKAVCESLEGYPSLLNLPYRKKLDDVGDSSSSLVLKLRSSVTNNISKLAIGLRVTDFVFMASVLFVLLERVTKQDKLHITSPMHAPNGHDDLSCVGLYQNMAILNAYYQPEASFREFVLSVRDSLKARLTDGNITFEDIVESICDKRTMEAASPFFQILFFKQQQLDSELSLQGCSFHQHFTMQGKPKTDLVIGYSKVEEQYIFNIQFKQSAFDFAFISDFKQMYAELLSTCSENVDASLQTLTNTLSTKKNIERSPIKKSIRDSSEFKNLNELIEGHARNDPNALLFEGEVPMTYADLVSKITMCGAGLFGERDILGEKIGVFLPRSPSLVISMLAIMKLGGCLILLDRSQPINRIREICQQVNIKAIVTDTDGLGYLRSLDIEKLLFKDSDKQASKSSSLSRKAIIPEQLAYIMFTSGSLGEPKGVCVSHGALASFLSWSQSYFETKTFDTLYSMTPITFDVALFEIFATLNAGGSIRFVEAIDLLDNKSMYANSSITIVPSVLKQFLISNVLPDRVSTVYLAGEKIDQELVELLKTETNVTSIHNLYGPTEAVVYATAYRWPNCELTPVIGEARSDLECYVLSEDLNLVPQGAVGQLAISGYGLSSGYYGNARETAKSFVPNPFAAMSGERMYLTGDLVKENFNGEYEYVSRCDDQIKVNGVRIEPAEIESVLRSNDLVEFAYVFKAEKGSRNLINAVIKDADANATSLAKLRQYCIERLPTYMVPHVFYKTESIPYNENGKLDRKKLRLQCQSNGAMQSAFDIQSRYTNVVRDLWKQALNVNHIVENRNFFEAGGASMQLIVLKDLLNDYFGIDISIIELFNYPTITDMSHLVSLNLGTEASPLTDLSNRAVQQKEAMMKFKLSNSKAKI